jgi:hypothetical protein
MRAAIDTEFTKDIKRTNDKKGKASTEKASKKLTTYD